jgi:hypothetical protein
MGNRKFCMIEKEKRRLGKFLGSKYGYRSRRDLGIDTASQVGSLKFDHFNFIPAAAI